MSNTKEITPQQGKALLNLFGGDANRIEAGRLLLLDILANPSRYGLSQPAAIAKTYPPYVRFNNRNYLPEEKVDALLSRIAELEAQPAAVLSEQQIMQELEDFATDFYWWWHNEKGTNTRQGAKEYLKKHPQVIAALTAQNKKP